LLSSLKEINYDSEKIMILFETFTSIDTVHKMMSEIENADFDKKFKTCIMSGTYNARTLSDGTSPREFASYCNKYDFIKAVGQNCCDVSTDIDFILSEYKAVTNKLIFCKPNTDAVSVDELAGYIRKFNI
jgi:methionine synthase I (cobalamin-dependent)